MKSKLYLVLFCLVLLKCVPHDDVPDYDTLNEEDIQEYIFKNNLSPQKSSTGLYYIITKVGSGDRPNGTATVNVDYKGYLLSGTPFDQNPNATFNLSSLIPGFAEGMTYVKEGGEATFIIPSKLAYGSRGSGRVGPGAVILFDVKLLKIQ